MTEEDTVYALYVQLLQRLRRDGHVPLLTISQWCGILYERKEGEGPLLAATHAALSEPWDGVADRRAPGLAQWERVAAGAAAWGRLEGVLGKVWYHGLKKDPRLFWGGVQPATVAAIRRAVQDVAAGHAALLLPPLGRQAAASSPRRRRPRSGGGAGGAWGRVPGEVWAAVAAFCVDPAAAAVAWRAVAGGEWGLGLWHLGRARWAGAPGEGLRLPGADAVVRRLGRWAAADPRLLRPFQCTVQLTPAAARWCPGPRARTAFRSDTLAQVLRGGGAGRPPGLRLCYRHAGREHACRVGVASLHVSLEALGLPMTARHCILDVGPSEPCAPVAP